MAFLYQFFIHLYVLSIGIAGTWNRKARQWTQGRKNLFQELGGRINKEDRIIWMHCASAGELEQGKPVVEQLKKEYPSHKLLISFFSPSGFEVAKKYAGADIITYLPADTRSNATRFVEIVKPELVIFVKYEYWYHHLSAVASRKIPLLLVSSIFRKEQVFFKWYGKFYRRMLFLFRHIFVQDEDSLQLLKELNVPNCSVGGDTRFDRVKEIAGRFSEIPLIREFIGERMTVVAGSTWPDDEKMLAAYAKTHSCTFIIAPHEINAQHIAQVRNFFTDAVLYSELRSGHAAVARVLIIDNIGMLSRLYHYADITYVGGGFNSSGIHNTLEAAVYGKPVFFGPNYEKFREAKGLVTSRAAFSVRNAEELIMKMDHLVNDPVQLQQAGIAAKNYVEEHTGATMKIIQFIQANRLLTS